MNNGGCFLNQGNSRLSAKKQISINLGGSVMIRQVKIEGGEIRGIPAADPRVTAFKGVPFAAPPVGENRWRAPQPV
ncbi:MAG: carboxylesterase family protein, partial [Eubacteriaceae bacterium]|nr:carboxylesterase family protein [Eubacteriaceae bacterium]